MRKLVLAFSSFILFVGCFSIDTSNPKEAYKYWAGVEVYEGIEIMNGEYYQSPHFTLEYEFFLKFKPTKKWWNEFIVINNLEVDNQNVDWSAFTKLPKWFKPVSNYSIYSKNNDFDRSRYFIEEKSGICYIYETVGM
ncbi:hypothetical protein AAFN75_05375 [Algibacter sp. AS12]|uniref:hypothetical protein n=1 Tax=Algibacter sp. AS12 TaxID=3135773 RepID=UPI00398BBB6F